MLYNVPLVAQTTRMSCWAASIAMILGWRHQASYSDQMIARNPGGLNYMTSYHNGLDPNDRYILRRNGFTVDNPMCYLPDTIFSRLSTYGPLWVATWAPGPHIRVVSGMVGSTLMIQDPAPVNRGSFYTMTFDRFFGAMETLGSREMDEGSPIYVAYLRRM
jgi:hypothetical protein